MRDAVDEAISCGALEEVRCDMCGEPITTGAMALFCPRGVGCEFWTPEVETMKRDLGMTPNAKLTGLAPGKDEQ